MQKHFFNSMIFLNINSLNKKLMKNLDIHEPFMLSIFILLKQIFRVRVIKHLNSLITKMIISKILAMNSGLLKKQIL